MADIKISSRLTNREVQVLAAPLQQDLIALFEVVQAEVESAWEKVKSGEMSLDEFLLMIDNL